MSYAMQSPWMQQATIKDNIVCCEPWNEERYQQVALPHAPRNQYRFLLVTHIAPAGAARLLPHDGSRHHASWRRHPRGREGHQLVWRPATACCPRARRVRAPLSPALSSSTRFCVRCASPTHSDAATASQTSISWTTQYLPWTTRRRSTCGPTCLKACSNTPPSSWAAAAPSSAARQCSTSRPTALQMPPLPSLTSMDSSNPNPHPPRCRSDTRAHPALQMLTRHHHHHHHRPRPVMFQSPSSSLRPPSARASAAFKSLWSR